MLLKLLPTNFVMPGFQPVMLQQQPNCSTIELHPALQYTVCINAAYKSLCFPAPQYCIALAAMHRGKVWVFSSTVASALELSRKCSISSYCEPFFQINLRFGKFRASRPITTFAIFAKTFLAQL